MIKDRDVLERNLELLLKRAYAPAVARESFRAQLERDYMAASDRRGKQRAPSPWSSPLVRVAIAATIAVVAFVAWRANRESISSFLARAFGEAQPATMEQILARGEVAWRTDRDGEWTSAPAGVDSRPILFEKPFLELVTPSSAPASIEFLIEYVRPDLAQPWRIFPATHVELERRTEGLVATLLDGGCIAGRKHEGRDAPIAVETSEGRVALSANTLRVAYERPDDLDQWQQPHSERERWVHVSVRDGELRLPGHTRALRTGQEFYLAGGEALLALDDLPSDSEREGLGASASTPVAPPAAEPERGLIGTVTAGGAPLDSFAVIVLREVSLPQTAEPIEHRFEHAGGRFALPDLRRARYRVFVRAEGWALGRHAEIVQVDPAAAQATHVAIALDRGATLRGSVVDDVTGLPLSDAYVVSETDAQLYVLSLDPGENHDFAPRASQRADGAFELAPISTGTQIVRASAKGYGPAWAEVELRAGEVRADVVFRLSAAGRVEGSVLRADATGVANAMLLATTTDFEKKRPCLTYAGTLTDAEGKYTIDGLGAGAWAVLNFGPVDQIKQGQFTPEMSFTRVRSGEASRVDFHASQPKQVLIGTVRDATGAPVVGRTVMVAPLARALPPPEGSWSSGTTGADGSYRIPDLEPGPHEMFVSGRLPPEMMRVGRFELGAGPQFVHDVVLPMGRISGVVRDAARNAPMDFAVLVLLQHRPDGDCDFASKVFTDEHGRYTIEFLPDGTFDLYAYSTEGVFGQEARRNLRIEGGRALEGADFALEPGGRLLIVVRDADGKPVVHAPLELLDEEGVLVDFSEHQTSDETGQYRIEGIKPGRWRVRARIDGAVAAEAAVEVVVGERKTVELQLAKKN